MNSKVSLFVEVCVASLEDALIVQRSGWRDIELNTALPLGGLTPSRGLVREIIDATELRIIAMVRPRPGGFCYSAADWRVALRDAEGLLEDGVAGLAIGALLADRQIDGARMQELRSRFPNAILVAHRAFDLVPDWRIGLQTIVDCGFDRVLSSGGANSAWEGREQLQRMREAFGSEIKIIAGAGITSANVGPLIEATGLGSIHGTFSQAAHDLGYLNGPLRFAENDDRRTTNPEELAKLRSIVL